MENIKARKKVLKRKGKATRNLKKVSRGYKRKLKQGVRKRILKRGLRKNVKKRRARKSRKHVYVRPPAQLIESQHTQHQKEFNGEFDKAYNEGFNAGFAQGFEDGHKIAYNEQ